MTNLSFALKATRSSFPTKYCIQNSDKATNKAITQELKNAPNALYTPNEIVGLLNQHKGITLGHHIQGEKKKDSWQYGNMLAYDIDNSIEDKDQYLYPEESIYLLKKHNIYPNIIYATPSSDYPDKDGEKVKFRILFLLNEYFDQDSAKLFCYHHKKISYWWELGKKIFTLDDKNAKGILDRSVCTDFSKNLFTTDRILYTDLENINSFPQIISNTNQMLNISINYKFKLSSIHSTDMSDKCVPVYTLYTCTNLRSKSGTVASNNNIKSIKLHQNFDGGEGEENDTYLQGIIERSRVSRWWPKLTQSCIVARMYGEQQRVRYYNSSMPFLSTMASWAPKYIAELIENSSCYSPEEKQERLTYINDHRTKQYKCWECNGHCDFYEECSEKPHNVQDILLTAKQRQWIENEKPNIPTKNKKDIRIEFEITMNNIMSKKKGIFLLNWETGSGKSWSMMHHIKAHTIYACPTHERKKEVFKALRDNDKGLSIGIQPDQPKLESPIPFDAFDLNYSFSELTNLLDQSEEYLKLSKSALRRDVDRVKAYGQKCFQEMKKDIFICTISKSMQLIKDDRWTMLMYDEDPAPEFIKSDTIPVTSLYSLHSFISMLIDYEIYESSQLETSLERLNQIMDKCKKGETEIPTNHIVTPTLKRMIVIEQRWELLDVIQLLSHQVICQLEDTKRSMNSAFYGKSSNKWIEQLKEKRTIISSATPHALYKTREDINIYRQSMIIKKQGDIYQYHGDVTFSQQAMRNNADRVKLTMKKYQQELGIEYWITFKSFIKDDEFVFGDNELKAGAWFFNAKATNKLSGKNIGIWGTPRINTNALRKIAADVEKDYTFSGKLKPRRIERHGITIPKFYSTACNEEELEFQINAIEEELIQAIGRARQINHDCSVYVFSDIPIEARTELREIEMEEVEDKKQKEPKVIPVNFRKISNSKE